MMGFCLPTVGSQMLQVPPCNVHIFKHAFKLVIHQPQHQISDHPVENPLVLFDIQDLLRRKLTILNQILEI
jgi:hypothetical protein